MKYQLAAQYREDRHGYTDAKTPYIWDIMVQADLWAKAIGWQPGDLDV